MGGLTLAFLAGLGTMRFMADQDDGTEVVAEHDDTPSEQLAEVRRPQAPRPAPAAATAKEAGNGRPHTVVFVVLDTVRSQNMNLCGYERPNTPFLNKLRDQRGAAVTCQAYTPGAWTLPSHASFFSGLTVPEHGIVRTGIKFPDEPTTLAEIMHRRGYQTAMVSGNGVLARQSGLQRGFQVKRISKPTNRLWGKDLALAVRDVLGAAKPDQPLFLFVNIYDAHDPYPKVPEGVDWVPAQEEVRLFEDDLTTEREPFVSYTRGTMEPARAKVFLEQVRNGYDYGIFQADKSLELVFKALKQSGRMDRSYRYVITSDHGEFLGEHGNLRHGCFVFEEVTRVPFVYYDSQRKKQPDIHAPFAAMHAFHILQDGKLPEKRPPPAAVSRLRDEGRPSATMTAVWASETDKLVWREQEFLKYDLGKDPGEQAPDPLGEHPKRHALEVFTDQYLSALSKKVEKNEELLKMLEEMGYVDNR